jgi:hypothetical protein
LEDRIVGRTGDAVGHIARQEGERIAGRGWRDRLDADLAERGGLAGVLVVPAERRVAGRVAVLAAYRHKLERDRALPSRSFISAS